MIAVVYSSSRYAHWKLSDKGQILSNFKTHGINPFFNDEKFILQLLNKNTQLINNAEKIKRIYFFGAGASSLESKEIVANAFIKFFKNGKVFVEHDLQAAALATCIDQRGIVGVLGTGSNAAYFDGKKIIDNNFGLGYLLGDEGAANWLGIQLLKYFLSDNLPENIEEKFRKKFDLDRKQLLDKIYKKGSPTLFLNSCADFLIDNHNDKFVKKLVTGGFIEYIKMYILPLSEKYPEAPIYFVGVIAAEFQELLYDTASTFNIKIYGVIKEPIYNLVKYYSNKN